MTFDAERPCFNRGEMAGARRVLFRGRPPPAAARWMRALNLAFYQLRADCSDRYLLTAVLTVIEQESGVRVDPPLENRNLEALLGFKLERLRERHPFAARLLNASGIEADLRVKLRRDTRRGIVRTEGQLVRYVEEDLKAWFAGYLSRNFALPGPVAALAAQAGISSPVGTIGPMQVNVEKAWRNARARGEKIASAKKMRELLLAPATALERGVKEGVALVWPSYRFYRKLLQPFEAVRFTAADFNSGEFSSRNAGFQERVARISGQSLTLDGDLLLYRDGKPQDKFSNTEKAVQAVLKGLSPAKIRKDLLQEKTAAFSATRTAKLICRQYRRYRKAGAGACTVARLPAGASNETARIKMGRAYNPENYARAFMRKFRKNLNRFLGRR